MDTNSNIYKNPTYLLNTSLIEMLAITSPSLPKDWPIDLTLKHGYQQQYIQNPHLLAEHGLDRHLDGDASDDLPALSQHRLDDLALEDGLFLDSDLLLGFENHLHLGRAVQGAE